MSNEEKTADLLLTQTSADGNLNKPVFGEMKIPEHAKVFENTRGERITKQEAEEQIKELRKIHKVPNTPFHVVEEEGNFDLILGDYKLSEKSSNSFIECVDHNLNIKMWHTIGIYLLIMLQYSKKENNLPEN